MLYRASLRCGHIRKPAVMPLEPLFLPPWPLPAGARQPFVRTAFRAACLRSALPAFGTALRCRESLVRRRRRSFALERATCSAGPFRIRFAAGAFALSHPAGPVFSRRPCAPWKGQLRLPVLTTERRACLRAHVLSLRERIHPLSKTVISLCGLVIEFVFPA